MSIMKVPLVEVDASITRPVMFEVARQIMQRTNIPTNTRLVFKGQAESVFQKGSEVGATQLDVSSPILAGESQLYIDATESPIIELITTDDLIRDNTNPCLFNDDRLGIAVMPIKKQMEVVLTFRYRASSKTYAERWKNTIWTNVANQRDLDIHTVSFSYPFPPEFISVIRYFHSLRENIAGYGEDFETYFTNHMDETITRVSNLSGSNAMAYKPETATRILGWFEFQGEPEKTEKDSDSSTWSTEFSYKFRYDKVTHAVLRFPVAIHNQLVDDRLFGRMQKMLHEKELQYSKVGQANRAFESDYILSELMNRYPQQRRIPEHDTIAYTNIVPHTNTLFSAIVELEENNPILLNLNELGDFGFDDDVMDYIRQEGYKWMAKPYACMLNISLYRNENLTNPNNLTIDQNLNVRAIEGTDIRKINRLRISYYDNIEMVMPDALVRLNKFPEALKKLVLSGDTKPGAIYRLKPRVDLTWLIPFLGYGGGKPVELIFDNNRVLDRVTVQSSHVRSQRFPTSKGK